MPYKILIILTMAFNPREGGVQRSTYKMSKYFKEQGHETHVFAFSTRPSPEQNVAELHESRYDGSVENYKNHKQLQELLRHLKPDIVINQMPYERQLGKTLSEVHSTQKILLLGCLRNTLFNFKLNLDTQIKKKIPKALQFLFNNKIGKKLFLYGHRYKHTRSLKFILDTYDYFIIFGPPNLRELKYFVGDYKNDKTHPIPNSILSVQSKIPDKEKRILYLSRVAYKQKRADLILPFWKKVMHHLPDWQFDIVGDGDAFEDLKQQIDTQNIPRVTMHGTQTPYKYYERAPIYIMTSAFEGFPNTLIEAQSYACIPVVYDSYPICPWVLKEGKSGILIPPFNIEKMAQEVVSLARDKKRQDLLMQAALENAREFHIKNVGKMWTDFFDKELQN